MRGLITALRTLTILPVPGREGKFSSSLPWFPWVGLLLGGLLWAAGSLWLRAMGGEWPWGGALLLVVMDILLTRGLHLDGLADWADAAGAHRPKSRRLDIMKDSRLGTFGVLALIVVLMAKLIAVERLLSSGSLVWVLPIGVISRDMMVELMVSLPYARTGEGMARPFTEGASPARRILSHGTTLVLCLLFGPSGLVLLLTAWIATRAFAISCRHLFGGVTGDLLGANTELTGTMLLLVCALSGEGMLFYTGWHWV